MVAVGRARVNDEVTRCRIAHQIAVSAGAGHQTGVGRSQALHIGKQGNGVGALPIAGAGQGASGVVKNLRTSGHGAIVPPNTERGPQRLIIGTMRIPFTKMHGAGNDFVVLDATRGPLGLSPAHYRFLGDRHFGVGADQILTVGPSPSAGIDFEYIIHNADGNQVEQCGNGARCFARFVRDQGLSDKARLRVKTMQGVIEPELHADGRVTVDMGPPSFNLQAIGFDAHSLQSQPLGDWECWTLSVDAKHSVRIGAVSMGNPHAVQLVDDVDNAPLATQGPLIQQHARFLHQVNAGFMQVRSRGEVRLRVYERGVGETLSCGSGACAAAVAGMRWGLLDAQVDVHTRGGVLTIAWAGGDAPVLMTGPATTVYRGEIELPDVL